MTGGKERVGQTAKVPQWRGKEGKALWGEKRGKRGVQQGETLRRLLNWLNQINLLTWINSAWLEHTATHIIRRPSSARQSLVHVWLCRCSSACSGKSGRQTATRGKHLVIQYLKLAFNSQTVSYRRENVTTDKKIWSDHKRKGWMTNSGFEKLTPVQNWQKVQLL